MSEEIKEVHIKTYDEWLKYYENATKEQIIEDLTRDVKYFADAVKDIKDLQYKLQQKEKIIKEVREHCNLHLKTAKEVIAESEKWLEVEEQAEFAKKDIHTAKVVKRKMEDILEILDKGE